MDAETSNVRNNESSQGSQEGLASAMDMRMRRARLNYVKERLKDLRIERERLILERDNLKALLDEAAPGSRSGKSSD
ncbi:MAG TPA: hypothetical protein VE999_05935 [Gemmataceae bacterium]|nr:hypothetical protein [Gemmataceae bacterium]